MTDDITLAYMCGLFDGEGSVSVSQSGVRVWIAASVYNTDINVLLPFPETFGGKIHYSVDRRPKNKPFLSAWQCPRGNLVTFAKAMLRFCREQEKIEKLNLIIKYRPLINNAVYTRPQSAPSEPVKVYRREMMAAYADIVDRHRQNTGSNSRSITAPGRAG